MLGQGIAQLQTLREKHPRKFLSQEEIFSEIHRGDRIFIASACGEPQYLVRSLISYIQNHPGAFFDTEIFQVWNLGVASFANEEFHRHFRLNSFFIGDNTREIINRGLGDYTPIFLSQIPDLFRRGQVPIDVALVQISPPDHHGYVSLGVNVDITKAALEMADLVIGQMNSHVPRVHGDGFVSLDEIDYILPQEEPLLEYSDEVDTEVAEKIGSHVASLIENGDTLQIGYGSIPNAILSHLEDKKHLGIHSELLTPGMVRLMKKGVVDNTKKAINRNKTIASFCLGNRETYDFIHDNLALEFKHVDYTNCPRVIAENPNIVAINGALEIDLTGQATAEAIGQEFVRGIGGQADFMRGAVMAREGKTILALPSTAEGGEISRIVPFLEKGAGVTLNRGDVHYVVTEYGIAYLHGKNIRERAMALISLAHPDFRPQLIEKAKERHLIYKDQAFIAGEKGEYPAEYETYRTTRKGLEVLLRPVKISDEPLVKDFFYSLSDQSLYRRFMSVRKTIPHKMRQKFVVIDYTQQMVILATIGAPEKEEVVALGQYYKNEDHHSAEVAVVVRDDYHRQGLGRELLAHLSYLAQKEGLLGFTAEVMGENRAMLALMDSMGFDMEKNISHGTYDLKISFRKEKGEINRRE